MNQTREKKLNSHRQLPGKVAGLDPRATVTFRPSDEARAVLEKILGPNPPHGMQSTLINEAITLHAPDVALFLAEQDVAEAQARRDVLREKVKAAFGRPDRAT